MKLSEIAEILNGELTGDGNIEIINVGRIESANPDEITFIANPVYEKYFASTMAGAVIVSHTYKPPELPLSKKILPALVRVDDPYISFLNLLEIFSPKTELQKIGIDSTAVISETAVVSREDVRIGAHCFIGEKCRIGKNVRILPGTVILSGVEIADGTLLYPNVTIYNGCKVGKNVIIHSGSVIGSDGFGQARTKEGTYQKIPQTGIVVIDDDVEIGSNCSIDRATIGETRLCKGVKLDNQIQVAHNVFIGENTVIAAHTGIAGSTKIGKNCMIGGKVGIVGHIEICDNVILTAATNVSKSINKPGVYSGYRAVPQMQELRKEAALRNLEHFKKIIEELEKKLTKK
jgi:UDP-3-O-[3-hydroxymyristoyl] glucosamine N-acyltransferase